MFELKNYQEIAVEKLIRESNELLNKSSSKILTFKSPTGSGKTIMMAEFLKRFVHNRQDNMKFSFIWIAVNKLHDQSKDKLDKFYENTETLNCSNFSDLNDKYIGENEILFFNWQSINKKGNIFIRENEQDNNLGNIVENTKNEGREIILIIDESHHTATSEKSREIIQTINPKITIEVTATPKLQGDSIVNVDLDDVKDEGMIKRTIKLNSDISQDKVDGKTTDEEITNEKIEEFITKYKTKM